MMNTSKLTKITAAKMTQNSERKLIEAQKKLSDALENLEKIAIEKIHETSLHSNMFNIGDDESSLKARVVEQSATIQNLNNELNEMQRNVSKLSDENEYLSEQNKSLVKKINQLRLASSELVDDLETDLIQISKIIKEK